MIYLSYLAARTGVATADELLYDTSVLHRMSHWLAGFPFPDDTIERIADDCNELQSQVEKRYGVLLHV